MRTVFLASCLLASTVAAQGKPGVELAPLFCDHMVLQRGVVNPVWGWAPPGAKLSVRIAGQTKECESSPQGRFFVRLDPLEAGGPHELVVQGGAVHTIKDVLVGEVWLASGQSNMAWTVAKSRDAKREIASAVHPRLRMFTVGRAAHGEPQERCQGRWEVCSPETVGKFSAAGYFFGRRVLADLDVPIGVVNSSWGGTPIEAWTRRGTQVECQALEVLLTRWEREQSDWDTKATQKAHANRLAKWEEAVKAAEAAGRKAPRRPTKPRDPRRHPHGPGNLFNGMIAPLRPFEFRGVIWYQGEANARSLESSSLYATQLRLLVEDWRGVLQKPTLPFAWVQLPNWRKRQADPNHVSAWARIRESMARCLDVPNTGMATTIDVGEADNIHPQNKQAVGDRLARWALARVYGKDLEFSGPRFASQQTLSDHVKVVFDHAAGLKTSDGEPIRGFAIAGDDRKFHWAEATIDEDGRTVSVRSARVAAPAAVRYAYGDNPDCNLVNGAGLPTTPFRTDDW